MGTAAVAQNVPHGHINKNTTRIWTLLTLNCIRGRLGVLGIIVLPFSFSGLCAFTVVLEMGLNGASSAVVGFFFLF